MLNLDFDDGYGATALDVSVSLGFDDLSMLLIESNAKLNTKTGDSGLKFPGKSERYAKRKEIAELLQAATTKQCPQVRTSPSTRVRTWRGVFSRRLFLVHPFAQCHR